MDIFAAFILGIIQGVTEFLPISSSAHLVFAEKFIPGFNSPGILLEVILHLGTIIAVLIYFRKKLLKFSFNELTLLAIATVPAGVVGIIFKDQIEILFEDVAFAAITLVVTGFLNLAVDRAKATRENIKGMDAFLIGAAQAIAIIPGISRSGATIFAGTSRGITRVKAAEFSFLLSIPAILGANVVEIASTPVNINGNLAALVVGFFSAFVVGYFTIDLLLKILVGKRLRLFGYYCIAVGSLIFLLQIFS